MPENSIPLECYTIRRFPPVGLDPRSGEDDSSDTEDLYEVRIIDNDHNTYAEVMQITMQALGISQAMAFAIAWEVDHAGSCAVAQGPLAEADSIAQVIRTIGIEVQVNPAPRPSS